jgi:hypothetical protein
MQQLAELSQRIHTGASKSEILDFMEARLRNVAEQVTRSDDSIMARNMPTSAVGIVSNTVFSLRQKTDGYVCVADIKWRGSVGLILVCFGLLFTVLFWVLPLLWIWHQKKNVRTSVLDVLARTNDEFENQRESLGKAPQTALSSAASV